MLSVIASHGRLQLLFWPIGFLAAVGGWVKIPDPDYTSPLQDWTKARQPYPAWRG